MEELQPMALSKLPELPLVSVLTGNYNNASYLAETLDSLIAQTYTHWEVIICDDGSTDDSRKVIESYVARDTRIRCIYKTNGGIATALNAAYAESRGAIIAILDSDDAFLPGKLERTVRAFQNAHGAGFAGHPVIPISSTGEVLDGPLPRIIENGWVGTKALANGGRLCYPPASALSFRRELAEQMFPIPCEFRRGTDAYLLGLAQFMAPFAAYAEGDSLYRIHAGNLSGFGDGTATHLLRSVEDGILLLASQQKFLRSHFGVGISERLQMQDNSRLRSHILLYRTLTGSAPKGITAETVRSLLLASPGPRSRMVWRVLMLLPGKLMTGMYRLWFTKVRPSRWCGAVRRFAGVPAN